MSNYKPWDLEQAIYQAWQTSDDLEMLYKHHGDAPKSMTEDEVANALIGIKYLHDLRCEALMDMMCRVFELNEYCTDPEKLARRDEVFEAVFNQPKKKGSKK